MGELGSIQPNNSGSEVQPLRDGSFTKLELVSDKGPAETELAPDSKAELQLVYAGMILRAQVLEDSGDYESAKHLREEADNFRNENGLEQVDESNLQRHDNKATPDIDKHAA